jgi:quercetin dioxygenase-like cupin family protein
VSVRVLSGADGVPVAIVEGPGEATMVVGPHMGADHRSMSIVRLEPGSATIHLRHPGEAVWYVAAGTGEARAHAGGETFALEPGAMVHVGPATTYVLAAGDDGLRLVGGPSPPDPDIATASGEAPSEGAVRLFHRDRPSMRVPLISSDARLVVFPGVGAETANMNYVRLAAGEENVPHRHPESEDTILILSGRGTVDDLDAGRSLAFEAGDVIHVPVGLEHRVKADRGVGVESVGGPCPPDRAMLRLAEPA